MFFYGRRMPTRHTGLFFWVGLLALSPLVGRFSELSLTAQVVSALVQFLLCFQIFFLSKDQGNTLMVYGVFITFPLVLIATQGGFQVSFLSSVLDWPQPMKPYVATVLRGYRNMYFIGLISVFVSIVVGVGFAVLHFVKGISLLSNFLLEFLESVPRLFFLVFTMGVYNIVSYQSVVESMAWNIFFPGLFIGCVLSTEVGLVLIARLDDLIKKDFIVTLRFHGVGKAKMFFYNLLWKNSRDELYGQVGCQFANAVLLEASLQFLYHSGFNAIGNVDYVSLGKLLADKSGSFMFISDVNIFLNPSWVMSFCQVMAVTLLIFATYVASQLIGDGLSFIRDS